jgi:hypothetical protein
MAWTDRYVDASASGGGTGTSPSDPWTISEAISNGTGGMRINIKSGTYSLTGTNNVSPTTSVSNPLYWRGYKTTLGDLDGVLNSNPTDSTDIPFIENDYRILFNSGHMKFSGLSFSNSASDQPVVYFLGSNYTIKNTRFRNSNSSISAELINGQGRDNHFYSNCEFSIAGTTSINFIDCDIGQTFDSCVFSSDIQLTASQGTVINSGRYLVFSKCLFRNLGVAIQVYNSGANYAINNCTFDQIADDAISLSQTAVGFVAGNYFRNIGGFAIGNSTGSTSTDATSNLLAIRNVYNNVGGQIENAFEGLQYQSQTESGNQFVDSASGDYSLISSSVGYGYDSGLRVGIGSTDYSDVGAIQHQDPSGGGGATVHPLYAN